MGWNYYRFSNGPLERDKSNGILLKEKLFNAISDLFIDEGFIWIYKLVTLYEGSYLRMKDICI